MKKRLAYLFVFFLALIPNIITFLNYKKSVSIFNEVLDFFEINTTGTHLSLGEWSVISYIFMMPLLALIICIIERPIFANKMKWLLWLMLVVSSIISWNSYIGGVIHVNF